MANENNENTETKSPEEMTPEELSAALVEAQKRAEKAEKAQKKAEAEKKKAEAALEKASDAGEDAPEENASPYPTPKKGQVLVIFKRGLISHPYPYSIVEQDSPIHKVYEAKLKRPRSNVQELVIGK